jgi:hypothetical protein
MNMSFVRRTLPFFALFSFVFFASSCKKAQEYISDLFQAEIKIKQEFDLDINELLPPGFTVPTGFSIDTNYIFYAYPYDLRDLDSNIRVSTSNISNFTRNDIKSAKVDSVRIYLPANTPVNAGNIEFIKISAKNNTMSLPLPIVEATGNFNIVNSSNSSYAYMMDLPVNPSQEFVQYMIPPATSIDYIFEAKFKNKLKFYVVDTYKLQFSYKFLFKK